MRIWIGSLFEDPELKFRQSLLRGQVLSLVYLGLTALFVATVDWWSPGFFVHPNLTWTTSWDSLARFWPLFVYAAAMALWSARDIESTWADGKIFRLGLVTSTLAGIWEEIGFRYLFVCTAMVGIVISNWLLGTVVGGLVGGLLALFMCGVGLFVLVKTDFPKNLLSILPMGAGSATLYALWVLGTPDPVYWFYAHVTVPVVNFVTLGQFAAVFKNPAFPPLFVFGMIAANAKFRDGHKYQGWQGVVNSWIIGFVMMYAAVFYGLGTAIVAHAIYDLEFDVIRYAARKIEGRRSARRAPISRFSRVA